MECIECKKKFNEYPVTLGCHACSHSEIEGYIETSNEFGGGSHYKKCWQCNGKGELVMTEKNFCSEVCREEYFEKQFI